MILKTNRVLKKTSGSGRVSGTRWSLAEGFRIAAQLPFKTPPVLLFETPALPFKTPCGAVIRNPSRQNLGQKVVKFR